MKTIELYGPGTVSRLKIKIAACAAVCAFAAVAAFAVCVVLALTADITNIDRRERVAQLVSGAGGCFLLLLYWNLLRPAVRLLRHVKTVRASAPETRAFLGPLALGQKAEQIPRSVRVVPLEAAGGFRCRVCADLVRLLPKDLPAGELRTVNGFLAAVTYREEGSAPC